MEIRTEELKPSTPLNESLKHQIYCSLDSCVMSECFDEVRRTYNQEPEIYSFERALQGPYLDIMFSGFAVDQTSRQNALRDLSARIDFLTLRLNQLSMAVWSQPLITKKLPHYTVLQKLFYEKMRLPEVWISQKGEKKLSTNREALEKLEQYLYARPFISLILNLRDLYKQKQVFESEVDPDGRYRCSYNIAGTETGRPSSSKNVLGFGGNMQNIAPALRYPFVSDPGYKLAVVDLEQVEARDVGFFIGCLFDDWSFLDACESGDLHTNNAKLVWPELKWTGDPALDRKIAETRFYRDFSHRDMTKRGGHLSNYMGTAWTASRALKVPLSVMEEFQARYCRGRSRNPKTGLGEIDPAFPGIPRFWQWVSQELQTTGILETPFGRRRHFFGRPDDDTTLREAIAFMPQSTTADRMNLGLWRVWKKMPQIQLLAQTYDSITFQYSNQLEENDIIEEVLHHIRVELIAPSGRSYIVPGEAKIGWNWMNQVTQEDIAKAKSRGDTRLPSLNLDGLKKWSPGQKDLRERQVGLRRMMA